ncbi:MAG: hypothetical protein ABIZ80_26160, partial [Bryobacteraceae bacterium]
SPLTADTGRLKAIDADHRFAFSRTLAPLSNRNSIIALTQSGFTVLPWAYDAAVAVPSIERIVNAADQGQPIAPGGLISLIGRDLSLSNMATQEVPRPAALAESCVTVNGATMPLILVSSTQVNAQLPFNVSGRGQFLLRTPGGVSDTVFKDISPTAPSVFRAAGSGTVIREQNAELVSEANPVRAGDTLVIYATGLGVTSPAIDAGMPAPSDNLALAVTRPEVSLNGVPLAVSYAGLAPGEVGIYQINVSVPGGVGGGANVPLTIRQGAMDTTLNVNVVE